ncbi:DNA-binding protein [Halanaerobium sp. Z-7514]|uniref:DNA-binding protein n=1 Tax=Halanaerobium polyolivorans TaxID=2886943 RepID=A0AAW4WXV0_9FIRM|nr:PPC domain-containing DNA-binding protein [Halanaerobium polyolivorans]MCC3144828.1 DNA-binding protein [Halanaerobium polyolivorans]
MKKKLEGHQLKNTYFLRLQKGDDLLQNLSQIAKENEIKLGSINALGAVFKVVFSYYDQQQREYISLEKEGDFEILNLNGNISLKDGEPMVHAHIILADQNGNSFGGHLEEGTKVFASEIQIEEFSKPDKNRKYDQATGLTLW